MPRAIIGDTSRNKSYIPKVSKIPGFSPVLAQFYKHIKNRCIHKGRVVDQLDYKSNGIERMFTNVRFNCLFEINEPIDLASLAYSQETVGLYHTDIPTLDDIRRFLQLERVELNRTIKIQNVVLTPNQILTKELRQDMKRLEELIRENVFRLGGHRDHLPASLAHMLYCIVVEEQYNLTYFFVKRIECARVMCPLALKQIRKPRSDRKKPKARHSISSSSAYHYGSSSHHVDNDEDDDDSRASTPSPTTYLNSLSPFNYEKYDIPTSSQQDFSSRDNYLAQSNSTNP
ncbi:hypothetical protein Tco_0695454 [Tanacetum coccineum]